MLTLFSVALKKCNSDPNEARITVVGTALVIKHHATVKTNDSTLYVLDDIDDWKRKYLGKKVKVTGTLVIEKYEFHMSPDTNVTLIPQQRIGTWKIIKNPKWSLVK